jgi:hypothetical protein
VPLSDHEQRLLEQMERALYQEDPKFASSLRSGRSGPLNRRKVLLGSFGVIAGLAVVVGGVAVSIPAIGVLGFLLMLLSAFVVWQGARGEVAPPVAEAVPGSGPSHGASGKGATGGKIKGQSSFMQRMEQRWRKRREGDGQM